MTAFPAIGQRARRPLIGGVVALALARAGGAAIAAFATRDVFAVLGGGGGALPWAALAALALSGAIIGTSRIAEAALAERLGQSFAHEVRRTLFDHISRLPASFVRDQRRGGLALRFVGDLGAVRGWVSKGLTRLISGPVVLISTFLALTVLDMRLGVVAAAPVAVGLAAMYIASGWTAPLYAALRSRRARLSADMTERVAMAPELRLLGRMGREQEVLADKSQRLARVAVRKAAAVGAIRAIPDLVSGVAAALVLLLALMAQLPTATTAGALAAVALMIGPVRDLAGVADRYRDWAVARAKCQRLLQMRTADTRVAAALRKPRERAPGVTFRGVCHGPLQDLNLDIPSGQKAALLGANGAGKTTALSLAAGLDQPSAGRVLVGGVPATALPQSYRNGRIALLGNRSPILSGSLRRAITLGLPRRPDDAAVRAAVQRFELDGVLHRLGGLDGRVSEGGRNLSVGEIWRILMARLSLGRFKLVLVDAPEAALDRGGIALLTAELHRRSATVLVATASDEIARDMGLQHRQLGQRPDQAGSGKDTLCDSALD